MSITIKIAGASFSNKLFVVGFPHIKLAKNAFLFGKSEEKSLKNIAPNGQGDAVKFGSPAYSESYATLGPDDYFGTSQLIPAKPMTLIAIVRSDAQYAQFSIGTYRGGSKRGLMLYNNTDTLSVYVGNGTTAAGTAAMPFTTKTANFKMVAMSFDGTNVKTYGFDATGLSTRSDTSNLSITSDEICYFGGVPDIGPFDIAFGATYDTILSLDQINDIYQYSKKFFAERGITIV